MFADFIPSWLIVVLLAPLDVQVDYSTVCVARLREGYNRKCA
jgi:hypothetical protein